jgi:hypothetical protein
MFYDYMNILVFDLQTCFVLFQLRFHVPQCYRLCSSFHYVDSVMACSYTARHVRVTPVPGFIQNEMSGTLKFFRMFLESVK